MEGGRGDSEGEGSMETAWLKCFQGPARGSGRDFSGGGLTGLTTGITRVELLTGEAGGVLNGQSQQGCNLAHVEGRLRVV